jgi:hypothetical protein
VLTLGLSTFLQSSLLAIGGGDYLRVPPYVRGMLDLTFTAVSYQRLLILVVATLTLAALFLFLHFHRQGMAIRAVALNPDAAQAVGINLSMIFTLALALGVGLAGLAGAHRAALQRLSRGRLLVHRQGLRDHDPGRARQPRRRAPGELRRRDRRDALGPGDPLAMAERDRLRDHDPRAPGQAAGPARPRREGLTR